MTHVTVRNGLTLAYTVALVNATLDLLLSFGVHLTDVQRAAIMAFVNIALLLAARVFHLPEKTAAGGKVAVEHVPVLVETPPPPPPVPPEVPPVVAT